MLYSVQRFAWKEGTPGWAGTAAFSLKKATPKHFRLEVYPFFFRQSVEHRFYAPRSFAVGRFCFAGKWGTVSRRSRKGVPHTIHLKKQLRCIYLSNFFSGLRITDAVWVALLAARGFSLWEIGLAESVYHIVSLLCEVPSGMAADLLGRKRALVAGGILAVLSSLLMAFAPGLFLICAAMGLNALSNTMFSGTDAALTYDSLKQAGQEERYLSVAANRSQIGMLASALGSLASTLRRFLRFSGFYLVSALFSSISTLAMLLLKEPVVTEAQAARSSHSLRELPGQFAQLVRDSAAALHGCPLAAKLIAADAVISVPCYLTKMFLQQRLVELGWPTEWLFLPLLLGGAACVTGTEIGRRVHPHTLRRFYTVCALLVGGGTFLVGAAPAWGGILGMMLVQGVLEVWLLHADQRLNALISSDQRATLISVDSMAYSILMIPASPFVGAVGDLFGQAGAGLALLGVLTAASGAAVLAKRRS